MKKRKALGGGTVWERGGVCQRGGKKEDESDEALRKLCTNKQRIQAGRIPMGGQKNVD